MKVLITISICLFLLAGLAAAASIDGNKFSFATVMSTPNGEFKMLYEGTVEGDTLKGTSSREGGEGRPFEAKRM